MAASLYNLARMTTGTTGAGTITLGSAVSGFLSFSAAGVSDGETVTYAIQDGTASEIGRGVYTASGTTLTRSVLKSTNSNAAISLSGSAQVFITAAAEDFSVRTTAETEFGNDNRFVRSDGTGRGVQSSPVTSDDSGNLSGIVNQTMTGYLDISEIATPTDPNANVARIYAFDDGGTTKVAFRDSAGTATVIGGGGGLVAQGRLTLTSGAPVTTDDVTAATTLYFTPYGGNIIHVYNGTTWDALTFAETSLSLSGYTADSLYDIFGYSDSGTFALESAIWASSGAGTSARATALVLQNGRYVKSGTTSRLYLGTIRITGTTGQCEDSKGGSNTKAKRYVWNYFNRRVRPMRSIESTASWAYTTATIRQMNANANIQCEFVVGVAEDAVHVLSNQAMTASATPVAGIGLNSITVADPDGTWSFGASGGAYGAATPSLIKVPPVGYNYVAPLEKGNTGATFYGASSGFWNCGIAAEVLG